MLRGNKDLKPLPFSTTDNGEVEINDYDKVRKIHPVLPSDTRSSFIGARTFATEMTCPICLDLLSQTMTAKECLHRFCAECINMALQRGNKECPTCRTKLVSRRNLRADPNFDILIATIFPDRSIYDQMQAKADSVTTQISTCALMDSIGEGMKEQDVNRKQRVSSINEFENHRRQQYEAETGQPFSALGEAAEAYEELGDEGTGEEQVECDYDFDEDGNMVPIEHVGDCENMEDDELPEYGLGEAENGEEGVAPEDRPNGESLKFDPLEGLSTMTNEELDELQNDLDELEVLEIEDVEEENAPLYEEFDPTDDEAENDDNDNEDRDICELLDDDEKSQDNTESSGIPQPDDVDSIENGELMASSSQLFDNEKSESPEDKDLELVDDEYPDRAGPSNGNGVKFGEGGNELLVDENNIKTERLEGELSEDDSDSSSSTYSSSGYTTSTSTESSTLTLDESDDTYPAGEVDENTNASSMDVDPSSVSFITPTQKLQPQPPMPPSSLSALAQGLPPFTDNSHFERPDMVVTNALQDINDARPPSNSIPAKERLNHWLANNPSSPSTSEQNMHELPERRSDDLDMSDTVLTSCEEIEAELLPALSLQARDCPDELLVPRYVRAKHDTRMQHLTEYIHCRAMEDIQSNQTDFDADPVPTIPRPTHFYVFSRNCGHHCKKIFPHETLATAASAMTKGDHLILFYDTEEIRPIQGGNINIMSSVVPAYFLGLPTV